MDFIAALASSVVESTPIVLPLMSPPRCQPPQHPGEDALMRFGVDKPTRARDGNVIRSLLLQSNRQKLPQRQCIGQTPCDPAFAVQSFEKADHHDAEVETRRKRWTP